MIHNHAFWLAVFGAGALLFVLPVLIGLFRGAERMDLIVLFNVLGLVTGGAGWVGAMVMAFGMPRRLPASAPVVKLPAVPPPAEIPWPWNGEQDDRNWPAAS